MTTRPKAPRRWSRWDFALISLALGAFAWGGCLPDLDSDPNKCKVDVPHCAIYQVHYTDSRTYMRTRGRFISFKGEALEIDNCDQVHDLNGVGFPPGCSVTRVGGAPATEVRQ